MYRASLTFLCRAFVTVVAAAFILFHPGPGAMAAQLTPQQVSQFLANPTAILTANPNGGAELVSTIRDLILSDSTTLSVVINLLANANSDQQAAIGTGLGEAAQALVRTNPDLANQIQSALAASGVQVAIASYAVTTGNVQIGSTGGGGGGGSGPTGNGPPEGGGGGGGSSGSGSTGGGSSSGGSLTGGGSAGGGGGGGSTSGSGSTTTSSSVSPH